MFQYVFSVLRKCSSVFGDFGNLKLQRCFCNGCDGCLLIIQCMCSFVILLLERLIMLQLLLLSICKIFLCFLRLWFRCILIKMQVFLVLVKWQLNLVIECLLSSWQNLRKLFFFFGMVIVNNVLCCLFSLQCFEMQCRLWKFMLVLERICVSCLL